jgi:hypothetical protein
MVSQPLSFGAPNISFLQKKKKEQELTVIGCIERKFSLI